MKTTIALLLTASSLLADPPIRTLRAKYHSGTYDPTVKTMSSYTKLVNDSDIYIRDTTRGTNWTVQFHAWGSRETNTITLFAIHHTYHSTWTNGLRVKSYWETNRSETDGPPMDYGKTAWVDAQGRYQWRESSLTLKISPDPYNPTPPAEYYLLLTYTPFRFYSPDNQCPDVYGRYEIPSSSLPTDITILPKEYLGWICNSLYISGINHIYPDYWRFSQWQWAESVADCTQTFGVTIPAPIIPVMSSNAPPVPDSSPMNVRIQFSTAPAQAAPEPPGNGCTNCPVTLLTNSEYWIKTLSFDALNTDSHFLFTSSSNLMDWEMRGLSDNLTNQAHEFIDTIPSESGFRFYKPILAD